MGYMPAFGHRDGKGQRYIACATFTCCCTTWPCAHPKSALRMSATVVHLVSHNHKALSFQVVLPSYCYIFFTCLVDALIYHWCTIDVAGVGTGTQLKLHHGHRQPQLPRAFVCPSSAVCRLLNPPIVDWCLCTPESQRVCSFDRYNKLRPEITLGQKDHIKPRWRRRSRLLHSDHHSGTHEVMPVNRERSRPFCRF